MRKFNDGQNDNSEQYSYYEDTHDAKGRYMGAKPNQFAQANPEGSYYIPPKQTPQQSVLNLKTPPPAQRSYSNLVVYVPRTPQEVQTLIDYLKRREPAIVNLDSVDQASAQRAMDFISGAVYALNGQVHRVVETNNIFLLAPEGVVITGPINN